MGALGFNRGHLVSSGYNRVIRPGPMLANYGFRSIHAEADAYSKSNRGVDTILVVRIGKGGNYLCSKPCKKCECFLRKRGLKKVYYIDKHSKIAELLL